MSVGTCRICGGPTPPHSNPGKKRKVCDDPECLHAVRADAARKARAVYVARHNVQARTHYTCSSCGKEKPLTPEHFYVERRDPDTGAVVAWARWCIPCKLERSRTSNLTPAQLEQRNKAARLAYRRRLVKLKRDPSELAEARAKWRMRSRVWRAANPAKAREAQRRYMRKVKSDPQLRRAVLERSRMAGRLRREREGIPLEAQRGGNASNHLRERPMPELPALPVAGAILRRLERTSVGRDEICATLGISGRTLYAWKSGERQSCMFPEADAVLVALGLNWWDVWDCDDHGGDDPDCELCRGVRLAEAAFEGSETDDRAA